MSRKNLRRFAWAEFLQDSGADAITPRRLGDPQRTPSALMALGRFVECRLLAVLGARAGYLPEAEVLRWLEYWDADVLGPEAEMRWPSDERLPVFMRSEELWRLSAGSKFMGKTDTTAQFVSTLLLRHELDTEHHLPEFAAMVLFDSDETWERAVAAARTDLAQFDPTRDALKPLTGVLVEGYFASTQLCSELWSRPVGARWLDYPSSPLREAATQVRTWTESAAPARDMEELHDFAALLLNARVWSWAAVQGVPQQSLLVDPIITQELGTGDVPASLLTLLAGVSESWGSLLWRLAPTDPRSMRRRDEVAELAGRVRGKLAQSWVGDPMARAESS